MSTFSLIRHMNRKSESRPQSEIYILSVWAKPWLRQESMLRPWVLPWRNQRKLLNVVFAAIMLGEITWKAHTSLKCILGSATRKKVKKLWHLMLDLFVFQIQLLQLLLKQLSIAYAFLRHIIFNTTRQMITHFDMDVYALFIRRESRLRTFHMSRETFTRSFFTCREK